MKYGVPAPTFHPHQSETNGERRGEERQGEVYDGSHRGVGQFDAVQEQHLVAEDAEET